MPRPDLWRLDPATYPHHDAVQTRFQDLDTLGHLNNVAFAALFEAGRVRFNHAAKLWAGVAGRRTVVAQMEINYLAEGRFPDDVEIATGVGEIGGRSWQLLAAMYQGGRCLATCDVTAVMDRGADGDGLPDAFRAALDEWRVRRP